MRTVLGHFVDQLKRRVARVGDRRMSRSAINPANQPLRDEHSIARELSLALDRSMQRGQWEQAVRIAETSMRIARQHPMLCERIARLRLGQGEAEIALNVIESCADRTSSLGLLHVVCLLQLGRRHEAHLELREFAMKACAPIQARLLLGLLEWRSGDSRAAYEVLTRNNRQIQDPNTLLALALINVANGNMEQALRWAQRVQQAGAWSADAPLLQTILHSVGLPYELQPSAPALDQIEALAVELLANEQVIAALVWARRTQRDAAATQLLASAIEHALPDLEDRAAGFLALCDLADVLGDESAAAGWAQRGARECPMSVTLARRAKELQIQPNEAGLEKDHVREMAA
jgi:hypothetical protein